MDLDTGLDVGECLGDGSGGSSAGIRRGDGSGAGARDHGTDRADRGFDADEQCRVWARLLREPDVGGGLREYVAGWGEYEDVSREGLWDRALATKPDYMLIQFGHNDMETTEHLDAAGSDGAV